MTTYADPAFEQWLREAEALSPSGLGFEYVDGAGDAWEACDRRYRPILQALVEAAGADEPCSLDHHGVCQAHFLEEDCTVRRAQEILR